MPTSRREPKLTIVLTILVAGTLTAGAPIALRWIREEIYIRQLDSSEKVARELAAERLGYLQSTRAIEKLISLVLRDCASPKLTVARQSWEQAVKDHYAAKAVLAIGPASAERLVEHLGDREKLATVCLLLEELKSNALAPLLRAAQNTMTRDIALTLLKPFVNSPDVFDEFVAELKDPEETRRQFAIVALSMAATQAQKAVPLLLERLLDLKETQRVRYSAAFEMLRLGDAAADALRSSLVQPDCLVRVYAAQALNDWRELSASQLENECVSAALHSCLKGPDAHVRAVALSTLSQMQRLTEDSFIPFLGDSAGEVRSAAIRALERTLRRADISPVVLPSLIRILREDQESRYIAAYLIGKLGPDAIEAVPELIAALEDGLNSPAIVHALGCIGPSARLAVPALISLLPSDCHNTATAIGKIGPDAVEAVPALIAAAGAPECKEDAIQALTRIGPHALTAILRTITTERQIHGKTLPHTIDAVAAFGSASKEAVPILIDIAQSEDFSLVACAVRALGRIGSDAGVTVPIVSRVLTVSLTEHAATAAAAAEALGRMGPAAQTAVPILIRAAESLDPAVRAHACLALGRLKVQGDATLRILRTGLSDEESIVRALAALALVHLNVVDDEVNKNLSLVSYSSSYGDTFASILQGFPDEIIALMPALIHALNQNTNPVTACQLLEHIGPAAAPASAAIESFIDNLMSSDSHLLCDPVCDTAIAIMQRLKARY